MGRQEGVDMREEWVVCARALRCDKVGAKWDSRFKKSERIGFQRNEALWVTEGEKKTEG